MERARARVVKVRESRERERRDIPSSMATRDEREAGGGQRKRDGGQEGILQVGTGNTGQRF